MVAAMKVRDMGQIMKVVMPARKGKAVGRAFNVIVTERSK